MSSAPAATTTAIAIAPTTTSTTITTTAGCPLGVDAPVSAESGKQVLGSCAEGLEIKGTANTATPAAITTLPTITTPLDTVAATAATTTTTTPVRSSVVDAPVPVHLITGLVPEELAPTGSEEGSISGSSGSRGEGDFIDEGD